MDFVLLDYLCLSLGVSNRKSLSGFDLEAARRRPPPGPPPGPPPALSDSEDEEEYDPAKGLSRYI